MKHLRGNGDGEDQGGAAWVEGGGRPGKALALDGNLRKILGRTRCQVLLALCRDCETPCTWVRADGEIVFLKGCGCHFERMKAGVATIKTEWKTYPPP